MKKKIIKNKLTIISLIALGIVFAISIDNGVESVKNTNNLFLEMLLIVPPIFILIGLIDIWIDRELMIKLMGNNSGALGILIAFILGSMAAGPLFIAFPIAVLMLKKGAKYSNVLFFLSISTFLFLVLAL